jgi:hypothetical protein
MDFLAKYCASVGIDKLMADGVLSRACLKSLEIIGEASRGISNELKEAHPDVPWRILGSLYNFGPIAFCIPSRLPPASRLSSKKQDSLLIRHTNCRYD